MFGYAGTILSVDLTSGRVERTALDKRLIKDFIGGIGINAKLAYDMIRPGINPLSPENVLIFGAGVLSGTMAPTACRTSAMAKSPLSGLIGISNSAYPGAMLKFAGYDHLIIKGKAAKPSYLHIKDDAVEIRDARHLWGKDIYEATDSLWDELGSDYWVACIGQAGENLVRYACILNNKHGAFGRTGLGAVMGSKNLKAIAVYGTKGISVAEPGEFMKLVEPTLAKMLSKPEEVKVWRTGGTWGQGLVGVEEGKSRRQRSFQRTKRMDTEILDPDSYSKKFKAANYACFACPIGCKAWLEVKKGKYQGLELAVSCTAGTMGIVYGLACSIVTWDEIAATSQLGQRLGLDSINTAGMFDFVMRLYEDGVITRENSDGLELKWGNTEAIQELMRKIAYREGFGNALADGIIEAAQRLGKASEKYAYHIKGLTSPPQTISDLRAGSSAGGFAHVINPRGWHYDPLRFAPLGAGGETTTENLKKYAEHLGIPEQALSHIVSETGLNVALVTKYALPYNLVVYSMGLCDRNTALEAWPIERIKDMYCAATGIETNSAELLKAGERIWNIQRAFNIREGASRKDDTYPDRIFEEPLETYVAAHPPLKRETQEKLLDDYYEAEGWDKESGKPTRERLEELGLDDIARDLEHL